MYYEGRGVKQDYTQAVAWYRKAAEQGNSMAQNNLGVMYADGLGIAQDDAQAVVWYRKSADQGNAFGQVNLGMMYMMGRGVEQNFDAALKLLTQAAAQNNDDAPLPVQALLRLPAQRGFLEVPLTLRIDGQNRILDRGTYVIVLPDEKRMLHPYDGNFSTDLSLREGDRLRVHVKRDEEKIALIKDDALPLKIELTTDFLIKELQLDGAQIPLSDVSSDDDPQLIKAETSFLVSPDHLTNGAILTVISRAGRESRLSLTLRDGEFIVATPADMQL